MLTDAPPPTDDLGMRLGQIHRLWRVVIDKTVRPLGLTQPRWTALMCLHYLGEGTTQKCLAESLGIELSSLSRTLDQLERQGLVRRRPGDEDRRLRTIRFTPEGKRVLAELESRTRAARARLLAEISDAELAALWKVLARIEHNALQEAGSPRPLL